MSSALRISSPSNCWCRAAGPMVCARGYRSGCSDRRVMPASMRAASTCALPCWMVRAMCGRMCSGSSMRWRRRRRHAGTCCWRPRPASMPASSRPRSRPGCWRRRRAPLATCPVQAQPA
ncbi:hypothetical protein G6F46_015529 [Rhizopus delemar]|nr:hypothetical protein G6F46_015529 [Rhizopus delemar]